MKLHPAISASRTAVPPPSKITFPSSSSYVNRVFTTDQVIISHRNTCCFVAKRSSNSNSIASKLAEERGGSIANEEPTFDDNKVRHSVYHRQDYVKKPKGLYRYPDDFL
ncbi:hypothetical protein Hanom_Chr09g00783831 [Helianthus anomalus]